MNPPAFQLYAADFYMDTASWPVEAVGMYSRFLFYQWVNGCLPDNEKELARIAGCGIAKLKKNFNFWKPKFIQNGNGNLQNIRLEETRKTQLEYREKQANSGRIGGLKTQADKKRQSSTASSTAASKQASKSKALQSSSSSSIKKNKYIESVFLSQEEYDKLKTSHGEFLLTKAIDLLNNYKMATGKKYKSDYHALLNWAIEKAKGGQDAGVRGNTKEVATESRITAEARELARQATERAEQVMRDRRANESADNPNNPHP